MVRNLTVLTAGNNRISTIDKAVGNLKKLERLFLASNSIEEFPEGLIECSTLIDLNLGDNQIIELPESIKQMKIRELYLMGNNLKSISAVPGLSNLEALDLTSNQLSSLPSDLKTMPHLKYLNLKFNEDLGDLAIEVGGTVGDIQKNMQEIKAFLAKN